MFTRIENSWQLFKASVILTLRHRKLLLFPIMTFCCTTVIAFFFISAMAIPVVMHPTGYRLTQKEHWIALDKYYFPDQPAKPKHQHNDPAKDASGALHTLIGALTGKPSAGNADSPPVPAQGLTWASVGFGALYFVSMFLATFFNVAFYSEIMEALNGEGVSLLRGLNTARSRLLPILAWSLLAGIVGQLIRRVEERLPLLGRIVVGLIGTAWSVAAVFAIPVIVKQPARNPLKILQQSAMTLKRSWGEGLIGYIGFSAGSAVIFVAMMVPLVMGGVMAWFCKSWIIAIATFVFWLLGMMLAGYISSVASHVYRCALYIYAAEGVTPDPYNQTMLDMAWKVKR